MRIRTLIFISGLAAFLLASFLFAEPADAADIRVMKVGLGSGTVTSSPAGISCGADCDETYPGAASVTLTAANAAGSTFTGWAGDCSGTGTCTLMMNVNRSVRAEFSLTTSIPPLTDFTPGGIQAYLAANPAVNSAPRFVRSLPVEYKRNWVLMSRSESLQTGVAQVPRLLLPSANAQFVFTAGLSVHTSYPGSHPNAIEYMQWDPGDKNFRFHEIVLDSIPAMGSVPARSRGISIDDSKCSKCHSTNNVLNRGTTHGTTGIPPGTLKAKNKPNWDTYDSWGGMTPFNRDRIYQGTVEAAAFRRIFNLWTWRANELVRSIIEQLELQPPGVPLAHVITRTNGGTFDGHINFAFDAAPPVTIEPPPSGPSTSMVTYSFDGVAGPPPGTSVTRGGSFVTLHHSDIATSDEGRGVRLFDALGGGASGNFNQKRIADEISDHQFATGNVTIEVRPIALAITQRCLAIDAATNKVISDPGQALPPLTVDLSFFNARNGMTINDLVTDTRTRAQNLVRRKTDIQKIDADRSVDPYVKTSDTVSGLVQEYGSATSAGSDTSTPRIRQEVFRRPIDSFTPDATVMGGIYVDRELHDVNTPPIALFRYFLEPLGVSVDKWSMGVRGRSRTYTFADVFGTYVNTFTGELQSSLADKPIPGVPLPAIPSCTDLINAVNITLSSLPPAAAVPTYTDVQRIFNKSCIECHGGLEYPPYLNFPSGLDLSENESPSAGQTRLTRSHAKASARAMSLAGPLYQRIIDTTEECPFGMMPCGGPALSKADIETIRRWIVGGSLYSEGDPHIKTIDGVNYDFQSAGEFVLLRDETLEIQARQSPVATESPLPPNPHTGLSSCVSLNTAIAVRIGPHRITYQPNLNGRPDPSGLQLRIDGRLTTMDEREIRLASGGRIIRTTAPGGIQIESPGGTLIAITPAWWSYYQLWYMNLDVQHARATEGVMGAIAPSNWLPALPEGKNLGPRPAGLHERYIDLYETFTDAWRVSDATTLFDYAPGTSTRTFTFEKWPEENPRSCPLPAGTTVTKPPLETIALEVAQEHCRGLVVEDRIANCLQDVMVTGEPEFAKTYLLTEQIERNTVPTSPVLVSPRDNKTEVARTVAFTWHDGTDLDDTSLTYRLCVWDAEKEFTWNDCEVVASTRSTPQGRNRVYSLLIPLFFVAPLSLGMKGRRRLLAWAAIASLSVIILACQTGRSTTGTQTVTKTVSNFESDSGKSYFWKVIVEDGNGGSAESETWRFTVE